MKKSKAIKAHFQFLRSIELHPLKWSEAGEITGKASPYVGEVLETAFSVAQTSYNSFYARRRGKIREELRGEKEPVYETELTGQAQPNVIFEAGMAMGMYPEQTVFLLKDTKFAQMKKKLLMRINIVTSIQTQRLRFRMR